MKGWQPGETMDEYIDRLYSKPIGEPHDIDLIVPQLKSSTVNYVRDKDLQIAMPMLSGYSYSSSHFHED